jgi:hypothetical protein
MKRVTSRKERGFPNNFIVSGGFGLTFKKYKKLLASESTKLNLNIAENCING